jgi:hypothetical protein
MAVTLTRPQSNRLGEGFYFKCLVYATSVHNVTELQQPVKQLEGRQELYNVYDSPWGTMLSSVLRRADSISGAQCILNNLRCTSQTVVPKCSKI